MKISSTTLIKIAFNLLTIFFFLLSTNAGWSQQFFEKTYGDPVSGDDNVALRAAPNGGYVLLNRTGDIGNGLYDFYLLKTNLNGDTLWSKTYGGPGNDSPVELIVAADGYYLCGHTQAVGSLGRDILVIKTNLIGQALWSKTYDDGAIETLNDVALSSDGGLLLTGSTFRNRALGDDLFFFKINASGEEVWREKWGGAEVNIGLGIRETQDGGILLASFEEEIELYKMDVDRNILWKKADSGAANIEMSSLWDLEILKDGGILMGVDGFGERLVKLSASGDSLWSVRIPIGLDPIKVIENTNGELSVLQARPHDFVATPLFSQFDQNGNFLYESELGPQMWIRDMLDIGDDRFILSGTIERNGNYDIRYWEMEANGVNSINWNQQIGHSAVDHEEDARQVIQTADGGFMIIGDKVFEGWRREVYVLKTDSLGTVQWDGHYGTAENDFGASIAETDDGGYILMGHILRDGGIPGTYLLVIKIDSSGVEEWQNSFDHFSGVISRGEVLQTSDGGYIVSTPGSRFSTQKGMHVIKLESDGDVEWSRNIGPNNSISYGYTILETQDGGFVVSGQHAWGNIFLAKIDQLGNPVWENDDYLLIDRGFITDLTELDNGNLVATGTERDWDGYINPFMLETTADGDSVNYFNYHRTDSDNYCGGGLAFPDQSHVFFVNHFPRLNNVYNYSLSLNKIVKVDAVGDVLWEQDFMKSQEASINRGTICKDEGIAVTGAVIIDQSRDIYLLKTTADGLVDVDVLLRPTGDLKLFPNPGQEELNLCLEYPSQGSVQVEVYDLMGRKMFHQQFNKQGTQFEASLHLEALLPQTYLIRLTINDQSFIRKWVKR